MAIAPGLTFALQRKALPDATDVFGMVYQAIARTFAAIGTDTLSLAVLFVAFWWLCKRYLFSKPAHTGVGEYLLCGFLSAIMLCYNAVRTQDSISIL